VRDDVVGELGVGGHTVVGGWVWPGSQRLANQGQGGVGRVCQSGNPGQCHGGGAKSGILFYCYISKTVQERRTVPIKVEWKVVCALSNGDIADC